MSALGDGLHSLIDAGVTDLVASGVVSAVRTDGLPQDWVDDAPGHSPETRAELVAIIDARSGEYAETPQWLTTLRALLA